MSGETARHVVGPGGRVARHSTGFHGGNTTGGRGRAEVADVRMQQPKARYGCYAWGGFTFRLVGAEPAHTPVPLAPKRE